MIKRVLASIDGSPSSQSALSIATSLTGIVSAELLGLYVEDEARFRKLPFATALADGLVGEPMVFEPLAPEELLAEEERVEREGVELRKCFQQACERTSVRGSFLNLRGNPATVISDIARGVDLIVLGNSGKHIGVERVEPGVTTNALLRRTTRPMLVVPEEAQGESQMVIAYDGSASAERMLHIAAEFAHVTEMASVHLVTVSNDILEAERLQKIAGDYLAAYELCVTSKVLSGRAHDVIAAYCSDVAASILALGAFGNNRLFDRIFGSTASHLLHSVDAAVLLVS